jgi:hypothetical protein
MTFERFERLNVPQGFRYDDHPFIDHLSSDYVVTVDEVEGWKVIHPDERGVMRDVSYFDRFEKATGFIVQLTNDNPKLRFYDPATPSDDDFRYRQRALPRFEPNADATPLTRW